MSIPVTFEEALEIITARLDGAEFPWVFTGSVGMVLQGMDLAPHDIDLQTDSAGAYAMQARLAEFVTRPVALLEREYTRSDFGALEIAGIKAEIMGDMAHRAPGEGWDAPPDLRKLVHWVPWKHLRLPVMDLEHEYRAYLAMGRAERASQIRAWLDQHAGQTP